MKKNKKIVTINSMVNGLFFKNKIPIFFIGLICFLSSYIYNFHTKDITYDYLIKIEPVNIWITEDSLIDEQTLAPQNFIEYFIQKYISELQGSIGNKKFIDNSLSFKSYGKPIDVSNFIQVLNKEARKAVYLNLNNKYNSLNRYIEAEKKIGVNLNKYGDTFKEYPELYKLQKLENAIQKRIELEQSAMSITSNINELKHLIDNFDELFSSNMYYSLNGWQIKDNKFNITEVFVAGLLFWSLLSSFFLFFRSNYFRKKLSN